jgi:hypothetical protein
MIVNGRGLRHHVCHVGGLPKVFTLITSFSVYYMWNTAWSELISALMTRYAGCKYVQKRPWRLTYVNWQHHFSHLYREQIEWIETREIDLDSGMANVLNWWKFCILMNLLVRHRWEISYARTYWRTTCTLIECENAGVLYFDILSRKTS